MPQKSPPLRAKDMVSVMCRLPTDHLHGIDADLAAQIAQINSPAAGCYIHPYLDKRSSVNKAAATQPGTGGTSSCRE